MVHTPVAKLVRSDMDERLRDPYARMPIMQNAWSGPPPMPVLSGREMEMLTRSTFLHSRKD